MKIARLMVLALFTSGAALGGCAADAAEIEPPTAEASGAVVTANGLSLNGISLNGLSLNGLSLNGLSLNGLSLNGATLGGVALGSLELHGTRFRRGGDRDEDDDDPGHASIVGARFVGQLDDGSSIAVRIDSKIRDGGPDADVFQYAVSYRTQASWKPLCGVAAGGAPILAIPLEGRWDTRQGVPGGGAKIDDPGSFTFACAGHALAKCVELGYEPWNKVKVCAPGQGCQKRSLAPYHQACTRMLRADYCGDGTSYTADGTLIDLYDAVGIQADTESWNLEAEWTEAGARCMARRRLTSTAVPICQAALQSPSCGSSSHFSSGTLLMNEDPNPL
jgi:hypothetical protein